MSDPAITVALTPKRATVLRRLAAGERFEIPRTQLAWLRNNGYVTLGQRVEPAPKRRRHITRTVTLTEKSLAMLGIAAAKPVSIVLGGAYAAEGSGRLPR